VLEGGKTLRGSITEIIIKYFYIIKIEVIKFALTRLILNPGLNQNKTKKKEKILNTSKVDHVLEIEKA